VYVPPPPNEIERLTSNLEGFFHDERQQIPPLIKVALIHAQFEMIHAFLDGNGRTGRLLITLFLCKQGILQHPLLYLSVYFKRYRSEYYDRLSAISRMGDLEKWVKFFLEGVSEISREAVDLSQKIIALRETDRQRLHSIGRTLPTALRVLEGLYRTPYLSTKDVEKITGIATPNARALIEKLLKLGILHDDDPKRKRNKVYYYKDYIELFKAEDMLNAEESREGEE
jgi:Fic family protein